MRYESISTRRILALMLALAMSAGMTAAVASEAQQGKQGDQQQQDQQSKQQEKWDEADTDEWGSAVGNALGGSDDQSGQADNAQGEEGSSGN